MTGCCSYVRMVNEGAENGEQCIIWNRRDIIMGETFGTRTESSAVVKVK